MSSSKEKLVKSYLRTAREVKKSRTDTRLIKLDKIETQQRAEAWNRCTLKDLQLSLEEYVDPPMHVERISRGPGPLAPFVSVTVGHCQGALDSVVLTPSVVDPHTCPGSQANDIFGLRCSRPIPMQRCSPLLRSRRCWFLTAMSHP